MPRGVKEQASLYFLENEYKRRIPRGVFPDARGPRVILRPQGSRYEIDPTRTSSHHDEMTVFERSPMQTMVKNELVKNDELALRGVSSRMQVITNLQNIKHSMKSDLTDHNICDWLFNKLSFTEKLIEAHLDGQRSGACLLYTSDAADE